MYARRVKDRVLTFGHRGWLYQETFLFYDYQTDSLWAQASGQAVSGSYKGTHLERLPATQTTWAEWKHLHPDTRVLGRPSEGTERFWTDSYLSYYLTGRGIAYQRHKKLSFGLAVQRGRVAKLYPFSEFHQGPLIADQVGRDPVVVVYHSLTRTGVAFDPRLDGRRLVLATKRVEPADVLLTDSMSHSTWSGLSGRCREGKLKGKRLRQLTSTQFVVENWPLHYPGAPVYKSP